MTARTVTIGSTDGAMPPGGAAGDVLGKDTGTDYDVSWRDPRFMDSLFTDQASAPRIAVDGTDPDELQIRMELDRPDEMTAAQLYTSWTPGFGAEEAFHTFLAGPRHVDAPGSNPYLYLTSDATGAGAALNADRIDLNDSMNSSNADVYLNGQPITGVWSTGAVTLTQGVSAGLVNSAIRYQKVGRTVTASFIVAGTGSPNGTNGQVLELTLPTALRPRVTASIIAVGTAYATLGGIGQLVTSCVVHPANQTIRFIRQDILAIANYLGIDPVCQFVNGSVIQGTLVFESAA